MRPGSVWRFLLCGGFSTAVNLGVRFFLSYWLPYWLAIALAYCLGMVVAFRLFKQYVYDAGGSNDTRREVLRYIAVNAFSMLLTVAVSYICRDILLPGLGATWRAADTAHLCGVFAGAVSNYTGHKHITFRMRAEEQ